MLRCFIDGDLGGFQPLSYIAQYFANSIPHVNPTYDEIEVVM